MADKSEQAQTDSTIPAIDDFKKLESSDKMQEAITKAQEKESVEQSDENSETSDEASSEEKSDDVSTSKDVSEEETNSEDKEPESKKETSTDKQETEKPTSLEERFSLLEKSNKELQAEFTRRSQRLKKVQEENEQLQKVVDEVSEKNKPSKTSILDDLKEKSPDAAKLLAALKTETLQEAKDLLKGELQSLKSKVSQGEIQKNVDGFTSQLEEFLNSPLKGLETELTQLLDKDFPTDQELLKAAGNDPKFFNKLKERIIADNFEKAAELVSKKKKETKNPVSEKERENEIEKSKGRRSKTSKEVVDNLALENFNKLDSKKQLELLRSKGVVERGIK